ncbi:MAG TPA: hypothetical protein VEW95_07145, partial [Candidatus Limnocylindrales bacterium]|nr:hypothetical protein [Candidatus Limnocylindrales bacterium]
MAALDVLQAVALLAAAVALASAPDLRRNVLANFVGWVGETPVAAHNIAFDLPFILRHLPNDVKWEPTGVFDTL